MSALPEAWFKAANAAEIPSPALLVYPERIEENVRRMLHLASGPEALRPHVKTHKMPDLIRMQMRQGIGKFKCATVAEAEMVASCGAADVLLGYQPVGPNINRMVQLAQRYPGTRFSVLFDDGAILEALSAAAAKATITLDLLLDVDCGMHRTGIVPGEQAVELYRRISTLPAVRAGGLHAYDGHIHDADLVMRTRRTEESFAPVAALRRQLVDQGRDVPILVLGGTPTFPIHARRSGVECSPGTCLLWDAGYGSKLPDLDFLPAASVLTRIVSKPGPDRLCLDLGHKAIASENPHPRVEFLDLPEAKAVTHSEEHLVIETSQAASFAVGDALYGIPWHICPTVALHSEAFVIEQGRAQTRWKVVARERTLTV